MREARGARIKITLNDKIIYLFMYFMHISVNLFEYYITLATYK